MAAMHYNAQMVSEDLHQHPRHLYNLQQRLQDSGSSPRSEDARSPLDSRVRSLEEVRFVGARSPDTGEKRVIRYHEDASGKRFTKDHAGPGFFQDSENSTRKCFSDELPTSRCREPETSPGRTSSPQNYILSSSNQHNNSIGKTSFCIDALLGRATKQTEIDQSSADRQKSFSRSHGIQPDGINLSSIQERESPGAIRCPGDQRTTLGNPLNPFVQHHESDSPGLEARERHSSANREAILGLHSNESGVSVQRSQFRPETGTSGYRNDRLENVEDDTSVDVDPTRTGSASPGSNASRSPASSPPISPGSEDPSNGVLSHQSLASGPYGMGAAVVRQNQSLLLHPAGSLIHPGGLYYHPAGGSAFHSIHKEGQPVGHPQSGGPHPQQHHIHPLQLEWFARTGMLYPRLPADLAGEWIDMINFWLIMTVVSDILILIAATLDSYRFSINDAFEYISQKIIQRFYFIIITISYKNLVISGSIPR